MQIQLFRTSRRLAVAAALAGAALAGCTSAEPTSAARDATVARLANIPTGDVTADRSALDAAMRDVRALAKTDGCGPGGCQVIGIGRKPCGGPWELVSYCPTSTDVTRLRAAAAEVERAERAYNERYGIMASDCSVPSLPAGSCAPPPVSSVAP